jgi:4a-hydroxytetrahydrobiopterin dehydratase
MMTKLIEKKCATCTPATPPLSTEQQQELGRQIPHWIVVDGTRIRREYRFKTYLDGARWVPRIGEIADSEDHHPDIQVLYQKVLVELWTHTIHGLSENDYIVAAKFDQEYDSYEGRAI